MHFKLIWQKWRLSWLKLTRMHLYLTLNTWQPNIWQILVIIFYTRASTQNEDAYMHTRKYKHIVSRCVFKLIVFRWLVDTTIEFFFKFQTVCISDKAQHVWSGVIWVAQLVSHQQTTDDIFYVSHTHNNDRSNTYVCVYCQTIKAWNGINETSNLTKKK